MRHKLREETLIETRPTSYPAGAQELAVLLSLGICPTANENTWGYALQRTSQRAE